MCQWTVFSRRYTAFSGISGRRTNKKLKSGYQRRARPWKTWNVEPHERGERVYGLIAFCVSIPHWRSVDTQTLRYLEPWSHEDAGLPKLTQAGPVGDAPKLLSQRVCSVQSMDEPRVGDAHACRRVRADVELRWQHVVVLGGVAPHQRRQARHVVPLPSIAHTRGPALQHVHVCGAAITHAKNAAVAPSEGGGHICLAKAGACSKLWQLRVRQVRVRARQIKLFEQIEDRVQTLARDNVAVDVHGPPCWQLLE
eukprot:scaffold14619_cov66-Phaeocystis_antarctica.AAC.4